MATDLAEHIEHLRIANTHEHLQKEEGWVQEGPGILRALFENYVLADLHTAGATREQMRLLLDDSNPDVRGRFEAIRPIWERVQHTGYGEAVRRTAQRVYGIEELTPEAIEAAVPRHQELRKPGQRLHLLREVGRMDHVQVDDFVWRCLPDRSGPDFFFYDISWANFSNGYVHPKALFEETGVVVNDIASLRRALEALFEKYAPVAIAVKSQHAYNRTLAWRERSDAEADRALQTILTLPEEQVPLATRLCLGDWAWAEGVRLSAEYGLPFKIHTGYYAGNDRMPTERIPAGHLCPLLAKYPQARFVLMHIAYPYQGELVAIAKHYRNVWIDFCWAWSIDPFSSEDALRRCLHAVPINKVLGFGGDTFWPTASVGYAEQARAGVRRALEAEIRDGHLTERQAIAVATQVLYQNAAELFPLEETRAAIARALAA
ncbi:MAG: hypothetical protein KatS3mg115_0982 [Candidatus Poribacteria bacterium]|nr:MAG: hypothetical protein KatS3mg115_0982 [Candidatus Poribacteria bacterium]